MKALLQEEYEEYIKCYDEPRLYGLRVNTRKISVEEFLKISPFELKPIPWIENGFYYDGDHVQPSKHPYYFAGLYYLQEPSAMIPANRLPINREIKYSMCVRPQEERRQSSERSWMGQVYLLQMISAIPGRRDC